MVPKENLFLWLHECVLILLKLYLLIQNCCFQTYTMMHWFFISNNCLKWEVGESLGSGELFWVLILDGANIYLVIFFICRMNNFLFIEIFVFLSTFLSLFPFSIEWLEGIVKNGTEIKIFYNWVVEKFDNGLRI